MKIPQESLLRMSILASLALPLSFAMADDEYKNDGRMIKVSITNISNTVFTPPIVALCKKRMSPIARLGEPASDALEMLAEGGDTSGLAGIFSDKNCNYASSAVPVLPGETVTLDVAGRKKDYLHMASMMLPTNDGFVFTSGKKVKQIKRRGALRLKSFDAGTEFNDELCANIPGPQCGGEGFNGAREANNFVKPHPGIQGDADVSAEIYNWGNPVALIKVK